MSPAPPAAAADAGAAGPPPVRWRVEVDRGRCLGSGVCAALAPRTFALDDEHHATAPREVNADPAVLQAACACPVEAITLVEAKTGRVLIP